LKELFGLDNSEILRAKKERVDKQYYVDFKIAEEDVKQMIRAAEHFNAKIFNYIEKLNRKDIEELKDKFKNIIS